MEINQLRYFVEVAHSGTMASAAEKLHITQQGISISIRRLETEINQNLFYQKNKSLFLTDFGARFLEGAEKVVAEYDRLQALVTERKQDGKPLINVAVVITRMARLPAALQKILIAPSPDYTVRVCERYSSECLEMLLQGAVDFAIVFGNTDPNLFDQTTLEVLQRVFIVNRDNPLAERDRITIRDLDRVPLVLVSQRTQAGQQIVKRFQRAGCTMNIAYECDWHHQPIEFVKENPFLVAAACLQDLTPRDLETVKPLFLEEDDAEAEPFTAAFNLVTKHGRRLTVHEQLFKHMVLDCYRS